METLAHWAQDVGHRFAEIGARDLVDIAVVAVILYGAIRVVRRTAAAPLVRGLAVLLAALWVLAAFFPMLRWLLKVVLLPGVVGLVIIFQAQLRHALERLGRGGIFGLGRLRGFATDSLTDMVNEVVEAVGDLSRHRTGALIAIERDMDLEHFVHTGVQMDALLTTSLLHTIFNPASLLHDGAVIVRGGRVAAAGCVLPTSTNPYLGRSYGMRHRAAIGLGEQTDAVVVVVSEETGGLSVAVGGMIDTHVDLATLKEHLLSYLGGERQAPSVASIPQPAGSGQGERGERQ